MGYKESKSKKKLLKYIERDDFPKLKSYLNKHRSIDINKLRFDRGNHLLHLACEHGLDHVVWFLLKHGADPLLRNDQDEVPLHAACLFALNESHYAYYDLVQPFIEKSPKSLSCKDKNGKSPRDLLKCIRHKLSQRGAKIDEAETSSNSQTDEEDWSEKIANETKDEYAQNWGNYEDDYTDSREPKESESYGTWADRMQSEMSQKRRQQEQRHSSSKRKRHKTEEEEEAEANRQAEFQRKLEREHEEYMRRAVTIRQDKMRSKKAEYENKCARVFQSDDRSGDHDLGYEEVPWPTPFNWNKEAESMREFLLCDMDAKDTVTVKKYLKDQQVRWHPDRFKQKCGHRLKVKDTERIMDRVKLISQILNRIVSEKNDT